MNKPRRVPAQASTRPRAHEHELLVELTRLLQKHEAHLNGGTLTFWKRGEHRSRLAVSSASDQSFLGHRLDDRPEYQGDVYVAGPIWDPFKKRLRRKNKNKKKKR